MRCSNEVRGFIVPAMYISEPCVTDADGFLQHSLKHRLKIARRAADDLRALPRWLSAAPTTSVSSRVRCCSASNSRVFSIAITA